MEWREAQSGGGRYLLSAGAREAGRSKAQVILWMARPAGGSTALRPARQRLVWFYVQPLAGAPFDIACMPLAPLHADEGAC
jgi:hypothetical protein